LSRNSFLVKKHGEDRGLQNINSALFQFIQTDSNFPQQSPIIPCSQALRGNTLVVARFADFHAGLYLLFPELALGKAAFAWFDSSLLICKM